MNLIDVIEHGNKDLNPQAILVAYDNYIEIANIENMQIGAFSPLTRKSLVKITNLSASDVSSSVMSGEVNKNILYVSFSLGRIIIAFNEPTSLKRMLLNKGEITVMIPSLVMVVINNSLKIFCYRGRLNHKTKLYKAPFSNMVGSNTVCFGNVNRKSSLIIKEVVEEYQNAYWNSQFECNKKNARRLIENAFNKENYVYRYLDLIKELNR